MKSFVTKYFPFQISSTTQDCSIVIVQKKCLQVIFVFSLKNDPALRKQEKIRPNQSDIKIATYVLKKLCKIEIRLVHNKAIF